MIIETAAPINPNLETLASLLKWLPLIGLSATSLKGEVQTIPLVQGSNFVSISLNPTNPAPSAVFGSLGNNFVEAYFFDNQTKRWSAFRNPTRADASNLNALTPLAMPAVTPGRGYIIVMAASGSLVVNGAPSPSPSVNLFPGMNLTGFPVPSSLASSTMGLSDVLSGPAFNFETAFKWAGSKYQPFTNDQQANDPLFLFERNINPRNI